MNADNGFGGFLGDLWLDLQQPEMIWQVLVLIGCLTLAWLFDRWLTQRLATATQTAGPRVTVGRRGLKRIGLPATMLLLVMLARPILSHWHHVNLLSLAIPLLVSLVLIRAVMFVVRQSFSNSAPWLASFERTLALLVWGGVALHLLGLLPDVIGALEQVSFTLGKTTLNLWMILKGIGAVLVTLLVSLWIGGLLEARLMSAEGVDGNLRLVFSRLLRAALILIAILIGLPLVGIDLTTLSVFGGALGVGVALGLQRIAANYVSGFIILLDRSIRIGNLIDVTGMRGVVTRITTRYTLLRGASGVEMIVPNELLVSSVITNETFSDPKVRVATQVQVDYATDLDQALGILVRIAGAQPRVLADPPPKAFVVAFAESGIDLEVGFWIADPEEGTLQIKSDIHLAIWREFRAAGVVIPYPRREVQLLS